jgi:hypothetical protein
VSSINSIVVVLISTFVHGLFYHSPPKLIVPILSTFTLLLEASISYQNPSVPTSIYVEPPTSSISPNAPTPYGLSPLRFSSSPPPLSVVLLVIFTLLLPVLLTSCLFHLILAISFSIPTQTQIGTYPSIPLKI